MSRAWIAIIILGASYFVGLVLYFRQVAGCRGQGKRMDKEMEVGYKIGLVGGGLAMVWLILERVL